MVTKPVKRVDLSALTPEQRSALVATIKNVKAAAPQVDEIQQTALKVLQHLLATPTWSIRESPPPQGGRPQEGWDIGAPIIIDERGPET